MAVSPLAPALVALPTVTVPPAPAEPAIAVTPAAASADSGGAQDAAAHPGRPALPLERVLDELNDQLRAWKTQLQFEIDPHVHQVVVTIVDSETGEAIRTIPSETLLRVARMIVQMQGNAVQTTA
ncbi:flagellar protein [Bordetella genomosp. 7]|uniref:Flagellar protein n=1 Tax=Bordetella genomosp. 7 TaxID=1416805 RepID=A0A261RBI4_9BORD|nr:MULTISPECIES: flagellar protein FlaG [Bordetella]OZI22369.1 flagellar protein [Bordetella genomosp. 7]OZI27073.1 flagellar protein [Bordetella genomosp. 7]